MDRLASCYFCGVAVEAPLEEYPVVPRDLRPDVDEQSTVVLCPSCRRKLSTVVERVVAATTDAAQTDLTSATTGISRDDGPTVDAVEDIDVERPDLLDFDGDEAMDVGDAAASSEDEEGDGDLGDERGETADDATVETPESETAEVNRTGAEREQREADRDSGTTDRSDVTSGSSRRGQPTGDQTAEEPSTGGEERAEARGQDTTGSSAGNAGVADEQPTERSSAAGRGGAADRDFSTSSYNRIVRLLQNREFPVEAEEITTVAANAYGIGRRETARVLDELEERNILTRDGGKLYKTED